MTLTLEANREPITEGPTLTTPDVIIEIKSPDDTYALDGCDVLSGFNISIEKLFPRKRGG